MPLIKTMKEIEAGWLAGVLDRPGLEIDEVEAVGTGQMSTSYRVRFRAGGEQGAVVVKLAATDENSRNTGVGLGAYLREINFYRELRDRIGGPLAPCHLAEYDPEEGWFTLVLDYVEGGVQGDQIAGCTPAEARVALTALARLHAPVWNDLALAAADWINQPNPLNQALLTAIAPGFFERFGDQIKPEQREICERFIAVADAYMEDAKPPLGLVHGDFRLDNLLFTGDDCTVVDWQTVCWGPVMSDASYFMAGALSPEDRREHEQELIRAYYDELLAGGVTNFSWEACWEGYRGGCLMQLVMVIAPAMLVQRTERGDRMFMVVFDRAAQMAIDLDVAALLPEEGAKPAPLVVDPSDEGRHDPGPEELWNESWYFDAVSDDGTLGVYHRIGRMPNAGSCLLSTCIVRPGGDSIMLVDAAAPLPPKDDEAQRIETATARVSQHCEQPLQRFRVRSAGTAAAHADHSAPLRQEAGEPVEIEIDLVWETAGVPFQWRLATRYEIPCRVTGTVTVDGETIEFAGPGQRDHSWGSRDWWASDWMWSGLHLDDGTHTHAVAVPTHPDFGVGYVQKDGEMTETSGIRHTCEVTGDGLVSSAKVAMDPGGIDLTVEPLGFGALYLEAPDGRVSHFPRAMVRLTGADGRSGLGWMEWNRNQ